MTHLATEGTDEDFASVIEAYPIECPACGLAVVRRAGLLLEVNRVGFDQWETIDVEHDCHSAGRVF